MSPPRSAEDDVRERYRHFATVEATTSPAYRRLAAAVAEDDAVVDLLASLPRDKRQPNLLFGVMRLREVDVTAPDAALRWVRERAGDVASWIVARRTQTNEVARAALLLPALALLPEPLALLDAGASAGLGLLLDRWDYVYGRHGAEHRIVGAPGGAGLTVRCAVSGDAPLPERTPRIVWRAGLDAHPLDVRAPEARAWLRALVWPEHTGRRAALDAAMDAARDTPPRVEAGDLVDDLPRLLAEAPRDATPVVVHSVALVYLDEGRREAFRRAVAELGAHRVGLEHAGVLPHLAGRLPAGTAATDRMVLSLDDRVLALADGHGGVLHWLDEASRP